MIGGHLLHGGDYNPEQWLKYPEVLKEDLQLMKEAGINCVSLGIFSWAALEPEEGCYTFGWLEDIVDCLGEQGIQVVLATPSGSMPHWLTERYPEVMQVQADGTRNLPGKRHNFCYTSPVMREKIKALDGELSRRLGKKKNVILWHISNELGGNFGDASCHCEKCQEAFRKWLKEKYHTLENLNQSWWNGFWSHTYTDWNQIHSPSPQGECMVTALELDWKRFSTEQVSRFCEMEIQAVREFSDLPATTNLMGFFKGLDYRRLQKSIDIVSWDNYPFWHEKRDEVPAAACAAAGHNLMRSLKKKPFLMMESSPSAINWRGQNPLKKPGMHMLSCMQAIAHGADSVQYFQWRKSRGGYEKFHGAVVDHKNGGNTRTFREVSEVGRRLEGISELVKGTCTRARAAILFDWENWWAVEHTTGPRMDLNYEDWVRSHYQIFWEAGIDTDLIGMEQEIDAYDLVVAPLNYMYKAGYADRVREFVERGGIYVTTCFSGLVDETDLCFIGNHPLEDVLGIIQEETDAPSPEFHNDFLYKGKSYPAEYLCDLIHAKEGTEVISVYEKDFYRGYPAVTKNRFGAGQAYYLAARSDLDFLRTFYKDVFAEAGLSNAFGMELPYGITTAERQDEKGEHKLVFVMNFREEPVLLEKIGNWTDAESGEKYEDELALPGFSCRILK